MADRKPQIPIRDSADSDCYSRPVFGSNFHSKRGTDVELSKGNTEAAIVIKKYRPAFDKEMKLLPVRRVVFSSEPIEITSNFQVYVSRRKCKMKADGRYKFLSDDESGHYFIAYHNMAIGFIALDPDTLEYLPPNGAVECWHNSPDIWMLWEDSVYHNGLKEKSDNLSLYKPKYYTVGCRVNNEGYLEFLMDGKNHGVVWSKPLPMDRPLWGFVDLPIEYKIQARFTRGLELPPSYHSSVREEDLTPFTSLEVSQEISKLESTMDQKMHHMQQELISSFQRHLRDEFQRNLEDQRRQLDKFQQHTQQELISSFQKQLDGHMKHLEDEFRRNLEDQRRQLEETFEQRMQQELASNLQKHSDALLEMQGQLQSQLAQLESHIQKLKM